MDRFRKDEDSYRCRPVAGIRGNLRVENRVANRSVNRKVYLAVSNLLFFSLSPPREMSIN